METPLGHLTWRRSGHPDRVVRMLLYMAAALSVADASVHLLVIREHFEEWWGYGAFFLVLAMAQVIYGIALLRGPKRSLVLLGIFGSLALIGLYGVTRTTGIPLVGPHAGHPEEVEVVGLTSKMLELGLIAVLLGLVRAHPRVHGHHGSKLGSQAGGPSARRPLLKHPLAKLMAGALAIVALLGAGYRFGTGLEFGAQGGTVSASDAEACARRGCDVHFTATLATQRYAERLGIWDQIEPRLRTAQPFVVTATTHAGTVRSLSLDDNVFLRQGGVIYPAAGRPLGLSTHHNTYLVFFPRYDMQGRPIFEQEAGPFELVIRDAGGALGERTLTFQHQVPATRAASSLPLPQVLMTLGAAMAALLFACTPCLVGSMAVGSMATGTATGSGKKEAVERARAALVRRTLIYLAALSVMYLAVAVTVNLLKLQPDDLRPVEFIGGLVLLAIGLGLLRSWAPVALVERVLVRMALAVVPSLRRYRMGRASDWALGRGSSSAMGASLAMVCSVAGAPTLSTAILLPLLVYAGLSHPFWAFLILLVYLVVCAVPFFFVAVGWGEFLFTASLRLRRALLTASALLLVALGLLLVFSPATVAGTVSAPARLILAPLRWLL